MVSIKFVDFKSPQELWTGKPPNLTHLRVFGCAAYSHQLERKLEPRVVKCVMLGYLEGAKGYMLWVLGKPGIKIINSRDVVFNESEMPCLKQKTNEVIEFGHDKGVHSEVKLTKFNLSHIEESERENTLVEQQEHVPETEIVEVIEPRGGIDVEEPNISTNDTCIQDYQLTKDRERRERKPNPRYDPKT